MSAATSEIVMVELKAHRSNGAWAWQAVLGQPQHGETFFFSVDPAEVGDRFVVEVKPAGMHWNVIRVVREVRKDGSQMMLTRTSPQSVPRRETVASGNCNGSPVVRTAADGDLSDHGTVSRFAVGDVLVRRIRFTSLSKGEERIAKRRPCVVVELLDGEMRVRPIFGTNTAVRRQGLGRRILNWRAAGLNKPSVVSAEDVYIPNGGIEPIGKLVGEDLERIVGGAQRTVLS